MKLRLICIGASLALCGGAAPALRVVRTDTAGTPLLQNGGFETTHDGQPVSWRPWQQGFHLVSGEGRDGSQAVVCERREGDGEFGASQALTLNRTNLVPLVIRGWSKAEGVTGSPDNGYSLYVDLIYADGTPLWGQTASFRCGTHDWERREFVLLPDKPIKSLTLHCLFRGHTGKAWFDDVLLEEVATPAGAVLFQGVPVEPPQTSARISRPLQRTAPADSAGRARLSQRADFSNATRGALGQTRPTSLDPRSEMANQRPRNLATRDGLQLTLRDHTISSFQVGRSELVAGSPSGFLARDFAANSDVFAFRNGACAELGLKLAPQFAPNGDHIVIGGRVTNTTGKDRAITLLFALPVDATGWRWGDDARQSRVISGNAEFANTVNVHCGADGKMSRYPLAAIWNDRVGLALALDMEHPAQYRLGYHAGTRQFFIAYDFGLVKETAMFPSSADFRFVLFQFDPRWGFRAALQKLYDIFPEQFLKRARREGVWMPFTDIAKVPGFEDFGFAFQEGAPNVAFDDQHGIASFVYVEPMSYWLPLPPDAPRTYESAMATLTNDLTGARGKEKQQMAAATFTSGIHTADGQFSLHLVKAPWCDGGVFTLNPDPDLPTTPEQASTKATVMRDAIAVAFKKNQPATNAPGTGLDGVYFDSFEMSSAQLNYRREHFRAANMPLGFDREGRPGELMIFNTWEFARDVARGLHAEGKLTFANAVLWDFSFPAPLLDVLGTEVNWLHQGDYLPDSDAVMNFRRALCWQKPYCLLLNTDYETFTPALVERYFQRCLFYGIWPGFFDQDAASKDPYWASPKRWYERDRALFKKYIPLLQRVTAAGWQPVTRATCDNPDIWLERYGEPSTGRFFLTAFNDTRQPQEGVFTTDRDLASASGKARVVALLSGETLVRSGPGWRIRLAPQAVAVLEF